MSAEDNTMPDNDLPANNDDTPPANNDTQPAKLSAAKLKELERVEKKNTRAAAVAKKKKEKEARETAAAQKKKEKDQRKVEAAQTKEAAAEAKKAETAQKKEAAAEAKKAASAQPKETAKDKSSRTIGEEVALINKLFVATADSIELNTDSPKVRMALGLSQESGVSSRLSEDGVGHVRQYVQRRAQDERDRREDESESEESRGEVKYVQRRLADMKQAAEEVEDTSADEESKDSNDSSFVGESFDFEEDNENSAELTESLAEDVAFEQTQRCVHCGYRPCTFLRHEAELRETYSDLMAELSDLSDDRKHALFRLNAYSTANAWLGGAHGKGNRQRLPECMENGIRRIAPSETGYTNFRAA
jgi:DNA repair exonuclease SbcCD ATPase subunit